MRVHVRARGGRAADPRADLVTGHDALEQPPAVEAALLGDSQRAGDDVDRRMAAAEATALVDLERDPGGGVRQGRPERIGFPAMAEQGCGAVRSARRGAARELAVLGHGAAGDDGAERVEQYQLGGRHGRRGERIEARRGDERREPIQVVHGIRAAQAAGSGRGAAGTVRSRASVPALLMD